MGDLLLHGAGAQAQIGRPAKRFHNLDAAPQVAPFDYRWVEQLAQTENVIRGDGQQGQRGPSAGRQRRRPLHQRQVRGKPAQNNQDSPQRRRCGLHRQEGDVGLQRQVRQIGGLRQCEHRQTVVAFFRGDQQVYGGDTNRLKAQTRLFCCQAGPLTVNP